MTKFNQVKFESDAKKLVAEYLHREVNEKELSIIGFSKVGADAKVMICDMDDHCFEVTYFGDDGAVTHYDRLLNFCPMCGRKL